MTDEHLSLTEFLAIVLVAFAAALRVLIILMGWQWTRTGRRLYR